MSFTRALIPLLACLVSAPDFARAADQDTVFDVQALISTPLNARTLKKTEQNGIVTEEVMFHSEQDGDKSVDIFGIFAYPQGAKGLPTFIWNQGGLAQASAFFPEFGAKRGYAALCIDFPLPGYRSTGGYPIVSGLELGSDPHQAPIYHGAVALLKAVSFLESRPEVDKTRIGMAGSSWGGFYTTLMAGLDPRLKAATCMFGCGSLQLGNVWWDGQGWDTKRDAAFRERWRTTLDPALRLQNSKTPIAWFTGTNDNFYWLEAVMKSYEVAKGPKHLSLLPNWDHALTAALDEQVFAWLDVHLKGAPAFLKVSPVKVERSPGAAAGKKGDLLTARWTFEGPREPTSANVLISYGEKGNWRSRYWHTVAAKMAGRACQAELPASTALCFVSGTVVDKDGFLYSTPVIEVDPAKIGVQGSAAIPDYNGCAEWGSFEAPQVDFLSRHGVPVPELSTEAKDGKHSAVLKGGKFVTPPILCTAGLPHRLSAFFKSEKPVQITLHMYGQIDGKPGEVTKQIDIGTGWTEGKLEVTLANELNGPPRATITVPDGSSVLMDAVSLRPVLAP